MINIGIIAQSHFPVLGGEQIVNHNLATELHNQNIFRPNVICSPMKISIIKIFMITIAFHQKVLATLPIGSITKILKISFKEKI